MSDQELGEQCPWCNKYPLRTPQLWAPFCSKKCAELDARDARETEADKWAMRYEM